MPKSRTIIVPILVALIFGLFINAEVANALWGKSSYEKGNDYLGADQYEKAIIEYEKAISENKDKAVIVASITNIGVAYSYMGNYEKATEYYLRGVNANPERGYYGYINLADVNYKQGKIPEAYEYSLKAEQLVNSPRYYKLEGRSKFNKDLLKHLIIAEKEFFKMRLSVQELNAAYKLADYNKAIKIAEDILQVNYHASLGAAFSGNTIALVLEGSIADINGLVKGDKVLNIDGKLIVDNMYDVYNASDKLFDKYGSTINITIARNNREIPIVCKIIYPEIEQTQKILNEIKAKIKSKSQKAADEVIQGPWLKVLEPKSMRGLKIVSKEKVTFRILGSDVEPLKFVTVNGIVCNTNEPDLLEKTMLPGKVKMYTASLPLSQGENKFEILATNMRGHKTTEKVSITGNVGSEKGIEQIYKRRVAVVIGINKYYPWPGLEFAVNDAKSIKDRLLKIGFDQVIELYDKDATRARILRVLSDELPGIMGPDDCLLVFFAGHGATEELIDGEKEDYIIPVDADDKNFRGTAISMSSIHTMIKRYRAKHKLFIFDSCYSGLGLKRSGGMQDKKIMDEYIKNMARKPVSFIMTAGGKDEQASEEKGHGFFTRAFLDAIDDKSGLTSNGYMVATDIALQVRKKVHDKSEGKQIPQFGILAGEGDFIFEMF